jgi:hypothetical protein
VVYQQHSPHGLGPRGGSLSRAQPATATAASRIKHIEPIRVLRAQRFVEAVGSVHPVIVVLWWMKLNRPFKTIIESDVSSQEGSSGAG